MFVLDEGYSTPKLFESHSMYGTLKNLILLWIATVVAPLMVLFGVLLPLGCLLLLGWPSFYMSFPVIFISLLPAAVVVCLYRVKAWLAREVKLVTQVGAEEALYFVGNYVGPRWTTDSVVFIRNSLTNDELPIIMSEQGWQDMSRSYSSFVCRLHGLLKEVNVAFVFLVAVALWIRILIVRGVAIVLRVLYWYVITSAAILLGPPDMGFSVMWSFLTCIWYLTPAGWPWVRVRLEYFKLWLMALLVDMALVSVAESPDLSRMYSERLSKRQRLVSASIRTFIMKGVTVISNMRLPAFVRNRFMKGVDKDTLLAGRKVLEDLGWPVNVQMTDAAKHKHHEERPQFDEWFAGGTDFATGIRGLKTYIQEGLKELNILAPPYQRVEEYKNELAELDATSRYFQRRHIDLDVDVLGDVWEIVRPIFANSRLTRFGDIIYLWEKKYALGFWFTTPDGRRKLSRRSFISRVGFPAFKELWIRTFVRATEIMPVAHVSVKDEALPPKKTLLGMVRSIIGSPLSHYIGSTVFNYWPNHNFQWNETPIKIGMPLNGHFMGLLFDKHARHDVHIEGDFTAFDSTVEGAVKSIIREVRKKGFESHKDHKAICDLIDSMYDQLDFQFLGHTSTGDIFYKGSGLSTGHSSTSTDNSIATVVFYMAAWRKITGLSAREFLHFNELSVYGDDHVLSTSAFAPRGWTSGNITKTMSKWGVTARMETKKLRDISFLGKFSTRPNAAQRAELDQAGLQNVQRAVWHDKARLIGKLTANAKNNEATYLVARLMSYLTLTAHHKEVYNSIAKELRTPRLAKVLASQGKQVPSYESVLRNWYSATHTTPVSNVTEMDDEWNREGKLLSVGAPSWVDHMFQVLSLVPDLLNPIVFNHGPSRLIQSMLTRHLDWIVDLLRQSNSPGATANVGAYLRRTPYNFIDHQIVLGSAYAATPVCNILRHWAFLAYYYIRPSFKMFRAFEFISRKIAHFNFLINGHVHLEMTDDIFPFDLVVWAAVVSRIPDFDVLELLDWVKDIRLPELPIWLEVLWNRCLVFVWASVPANFNEVNPVLKTLRGGDRPVVIVAPTGVGKSTSLVAHIRRSAGVPHRKTILIEPRSLLVVGLSNYLNTAFGLSVSGATTGLDFDPSASVWVMTPQSFLGHLHLVSKEDLVLLDEAHIPEPLYPLLLRMLPAWNFRVVALTATPTADLLALSGIVMDIPLAQLFKVQYHTERVESVGAYRKKALDFANDNPSVRKILVIFDTPEDAEWAAAHSNYPSQVLSSRHDLVVRDTSRYFSTTICDVGVTIPGLDVVVSPNWLYAGSGMRYEITQAVINQRSGRTGRTNNGRFLLLAAPDKFPPMPVVTPDLSWKEAMAAGVSPVLGFKMEPEVMASVFGLTNTSEDKMAEFARVSHIFLGNFRKLTALQLEQLNDPTSTGKNAVLVPTTLLGRWSASVPQDLQGMQQDVMQLLTKLLHCVDMGENAMGLLRDPLTRLNTGPLAKVANVLMGLGNDPSEWAPDLYASSREETVVDFDKEISTILSILDGLK
ncbi:RNA-dependent RNA polymerase [Gaeumannomyces tritici fusarivirus 1]|uniref:RNA-dependent RNA polymerase n=1 Tax=Gaeumannomyces tritici fusarivirus 1 TaxID=2501217 RepID=A0A3T0D0R4_9VIRU|nr:RNA-dependent RNA polymerase [Gaeumannomyces tritici fusarivirus 1]